MNSCRPRPQERRCLPTLTRTYRLVGEAARESFLRDGVVHRASRHPAPFHAAHERGRIRYRGDWARGERAMFEAAGYGDGDTIDGTFFPRLWSRRVNPTQVNR